MIYLEAQNRDPMRPECGVNFPQDVWPALLQMGMEIEVMLFGARGKVPRLQSGEVEHLGRLVGLDGAKLDEVRYLSYYGGNMNALFRTPNHRLIVELTSRWPVVEVRDELDPFPPSWTAREEQGFLVLLGEAPSDLSFTFGHDGDPLFVFSEIESIRALAAKAIHR